MKNCICGWAPQYRFEGVITCTNRECHRSPSVTRPNKKYATVAWNNLINDLEEIQNNQKD